MGLWVYIGTLLFGSMMNAFFMLMIVGSLAGSTLLKLQSHMQKVRGNPSWLLTLSQLIMGSCHQQKEGNWLALKSSQGRIGMDTSVMMTCWYKYRMPLILSTSSILMMTMSSSLIMLAHTPSELRMPFQHGTCLRGHLSQVPTGW